MHPKIIELQPKLLVGMNLSMSFTDNRTGELWQSFMPRRGEIRHRIGNEFFSLQNYSDTGAHPSSPNVHFVKWAAVEVSQSIQAPQGMENYNLAGGKYAVFRHKGPANQVPETISKIFGDWLPQSEYQVATRAHFEVLPEGYNPVDPLAHEDIWIPIER